MRTLVLILYCAAFLNSRFAFGATYNFYFNNAEQGDNSSAAPSVVVNDGKDGETAAAPAGSGTSPAVATAQAVPELTLPERIQKRWVRLQGGASAVEVSGTDSWLSLPGGNYFGPQLQFSFLPIKYFGVSVFYGTAAGLELDIVPFHLADGRLELGGMLGLSSIPDHGGVGVHAGARMTWNVAYPLAVTAAARSGALLLANSYVSIEGGLSYSF